MLINYDLYDISYALVLIRSDIKNPKNTEILEKIKEALASDYTGAEENTVRRCLAEIPDLDKAKWRFAYHENVYVNRSVMKNQQLYILLLKVCDELIKDLKSESYEKAYDLADIFHCLPEIIADNNHTIPESYWIHYVGRYRKNWDMNFLVNEEIIMMR